MVNHIQQRCEAPIVIEPALLMSPKPLERRSTICFIGRAFRLEIIYADFRRFVHIPTRFGKQRWNVTRRASCFAVEQRLPAHRSRFIEAILWWRWRRNGQLVEMKRRQFGRDKVGRSSDITKSILSSDRKLLRIVQSGIVECASSVHLQVGDKCIPVADTAPPCPRMQINAGKT